MMDLAKILLSVRLIRQEDLETAQRMAANNGRKLSQVLVENGFITQKTLSAIFSFYLNLQTVDLESYKFQPEAAALIPKRIAREDNVVPLALEGDSLLVCMADPSDQETINILAEVSRKDIKPVVPLGGEISAAIDKIYKKIE